ncbi:MAG: serine/threonine protein kinase, partial [Rubripirellula sp.]
MNSLGDTTAQQDADEGFDQVLDEIAEMIFRGDEVNAAALKLHFPAHADQIQALLPALSSMVSLGIAEDGGISNRHHLAGSTDTSQAGFSESLGGAHAETQTRLDLPNKEKRIGDFQIVRKIGSGGMGVVYEAHQISMGRRVALKVLPLAALAQERGVQRFHNEVRAVAALDHPNIVSVYSVGEERGVHYYAMRL